MTTTKYSMSFTTGALFYHESAKIVELFSFLKHWEKIREVVVAENTIQARTTNTLKRITNEIISRLRTLSEQELTFFAEATYIERRYILWLAICRRYAFIGDFAVDVIHDNFISLKNTVSYDDYAIFFNKKAEWHNEVDRVAASTRRKLRQTLFQILREANLLDKNNTIIPVTPGTGFQKLLASVKGRETLFFPIPGLVR
ncbi:DUF1819 family protein [Bilophila wadsworthia]|uniref:DUF1819 family protein n=1 Tax=Bilophila wadsworthia TaxID=35833 RepID=UPI002430EC18|nr:DUF1819 family protein [Bilophila wadsworthia]